MAKTGEGPKPTRMELLALRKRLALAKRGYELLEEKRDALISRFFELIKLRNNLRKDVEENLKQIYEKYKEAKAILGRDIDSVIAAIPPIKNTEIVKQYIMGVSVPKIRKVEWEPKYTLYASAAAFDEMLKLMKSTTENLVKLIEVEHALLELSDEIMKTRRRVNALKYTMIPKLQRSIKWISLVLEERAREEFYRKKLIKRKKEEAYA
ncbi:MAG: V-type ATP synthase subunit D [Euryarchaeota archaeon]|nr:V-type ATP synthase subunit D [Euryarchaeota archaeon]MCD6158628.1 V-type ATP synthase subunit D [Euryarchaeota archaeon]